MLNDEIMPLYQFSESHSIAVAAPPDRTFRAIREMTPGEIPTFRLLMGARALPSLVMRTARPFAKEHSLLAQALMMGFVLLAERDNEEIIVGGVGRFWRPRGDIKLIDEAEFSSFAEPGYAKAVVSFHLRPAGSGTSVTTITRVLTTDEAARRKFALYWAGIRPFSGLIRRSWLRAVKHRAEGGA